MGGNHLETDDLIVLLLGAPSRNPHLQHRINGITRLEKLVYIIVQDQELVNNLLKEPPVFEANNFGPFSQDIYKAVETLEAAGLVRERSREAANNDDLWEFHEYIGEPDSPAYTERQFELTDVGRKYFQATASLVPNQAIDQVAEVKERYGSLPLRQLIRYVYRALDADPKKRHLLDKSIIRDDVLGA